MDAIVREVADHLRVSPEQILAPGQKRNRARNLAIYLSRELTGLSCQELGRRFGAISGAAITMQHKQFVRQTQEDRRVARDALQLRRRIANA